VIECSNTRGEPSVCLNVEGAAAEIFRETSRELTSRNYVISIRPLVLLKNCLPVPLYYACGGQEQFRALQEGDSGVLEVKEYGAHGKQLHFCESFLNWCSRKTVTLL
jgi:hypothetical protein